MKANEATEDDRCSLSAPSKLLMSLGLSNKIFSRMDLLSDYWQVPMPPELRQITVFSTHKGLFEWLRIPFGLKSPLITFQGMFNSFSSDKLGKEVFAYIDDIIICSKDVHIHFDRLAAVLLKTARRWPEGQALKCEFLKVKISFLGHTVSGHGIYAMYDKISAIKNFPQPRSNENILAFLWL